MWSVYLDGKILYSPRLTEKGYQIYDDAEFVAELNKSSSFTFAIPITNPRYKDVKEMSSIVEVYRKNELIFRGRVLSARVNFKNDLNCVCESELAYLNDSIQRPFSFPVNENEATPADYFRFLIERHNEQVEEYQRFEVGEITVQDANDYIARSDREYSSTWALVEDGLIKSFGGFLWLRYVDGVKYIDYLEDFNILSNQPIELALNLLDISTYSNAEGVCSAVIPLGAKLENSEERLTIASLEDEETDDICKLGDVIYSKKAVQMYGWILQPVIFDDVTLALNLKNKGIEKLGQQRALPSTITITAADLSGAGYDVNGFNIGRYVEIESDLHEISHNLNPNYLIKKINIKLFHPANNKIQVGSTSYSFLVQSSSSQKETFTQLEKDIRESLAGEHANLTNELKQYTNSLVSQSGDEIKSYVESGFTTKDETAEIVKSVSTEITQNSEQIEIRFEAQSKNLEDLEAGTDIRFQEINSFIRLKDGKIYLGIEGDEIQLVQSNNKVAFVDVGTGLEVAYIANSRFYTPSLTVTDEMDWGGYRITSTNGLVFKWVGGM